MAYFSNGTEGDMYQEDNCHFCAHWTDEYGCPIWFLHELHVGEKTWQKTLDRLIPMVPKIINGIEHSFAGECVGYRQSETPAEPPLRPTQVAALKEWQERGVGAPASEPQRRGTR